MTKYTIEFTSDGKLTVKDAEFIRRLKMLLRQDQRLILAFDPENSREAMISNLRCPIDLVCPPPQSKGCPGPEDAYCPIYLHDVKLDITNQWVIDEQWKNMGDPSR